MLTKIGFFIDNLGPNQLAYQLVKSINQHLTEIDSFDPIIFWKNCQPFVIKPNFSTMNFYELYRYNGNAIATCLNTATRLLDYFVDDRYFYVWDLEWTKMNRPYEQLADIYQNPKLKLIARSQQHADIIRTTWGINCIGVVEDARIEKFLELINKSGG